jgi:hypothetical protein
MGAQRAQDRHIHVRAQIALAIVQIVDPVHELKSIKWADSGFGVAQSLDGTIFTVNGTDVSPLALPQPYKPNQQVDYGLTKSRMVYVSMGRSIYAGKNGNQKI